MSCCRSPQKRQMCIRDRVVGLGYDYLRELAKTHSDDRAPLAVSLIGPRNQVAKLVRDLSLIHI